MPIRVAVDTMGGDLGHRVIIRGAVRFLLEDKINDTEIVFVGPEESVREYMKEIKADDKRFSVRNANSFIAMDAPPTDGIRKKDSSIAVAHRLLKEGTVDALVSTGNTGAVMASAIFNLRRIGGVSRPAIASMFPTSGDKPALMLDVGANAVCKVHNLLEFAHMGSVYYSYMIDAPRPRVALLSIGEENSKGNEVTVEANRQLSSGSLNFIGNIEGRDVLTGKADVVICDGFVGNILLKFAESMKSFIFDKFRRQVSTNLFSRVGAGLMAPFLGRLKKTFDYSQYGGAPLLGVNGVTIICHGSSNEKAVMNGIRVARDMVARKVNEHIVDQLSSLRSLVRVKGNGSE